MNLKQSFCLKFIIVPFIWLTFAAFLQNWAKAHVEQPKDQQGIGIDEKLGQTIPLDLTFNDESDNPVSLRQLIHQPTILAPVYYHCSDVCSFLLSNLAGVLNKLPSEPGKEYQVLSVSFDGENTKPPTSFQKIASTHWPGNLFKSSNIRDPYSPLWDKSDSLGYGNIRHILVQWYLYAFEEKDGLCSDTRGDDWWNSSPHRLGIWRRYLP